jgi:hypothetical protein
MGNKISRISADFNFGTALSIGTDFGIGHGYLGDDSGVWAAFTLC